MVFKKDNIPWNKGLKGYREGLPRWNSGFKGYTNKGSFKKGQISPIKGKRIWKDKIHPMKGKNHTKESIDKIINTKFKRWKEGKYIINKISKAELKVKEQLEFNKIKFIHQYPYPLGVADFYLSNLNLIIQCYGDYWHSKSDYIERDKKQNKWFTDNGYNVLILNSEKILEDGIKGVIEFVRNKNTI